MSERFTLGSFLQKFKDNDDCLEELFRIKYPKGAFCQNCKKITKFYKHSKRPVYLCSCGYQISPLAGTVFEKTTTPLQYWFYAIFLMSSTRSGISAKQLQRELGVTYKTAWRMFKQIRILMAQKPSLLTGIVEVDETFFGGKGKNRAYDWRANRPKEIVMGIVQRRGKAYVKHVPNSTKWTLINQIKENVDSKAHIMTDDFVGYKGLYEHGYFNHHSVNHSEREYVRDHLFHTNNVEGFWSHVKRGVYGVYKNVSKKYLQAYVDEFAFRYNHRSQQERMFDILLSQIANTKIIKVDKN